MNQSQFQKGERRLPFSSLDIVLNQSNAKKLFDEKSVAGEAISRLELIPERFHSNCWRTYLDSFRKPQLENLRSEWSRSAARLENFVHVNGDDVVRFRDNQVAFRLRTDGSTRLRQLFSPGNVFFLSKSDLSGKERPWEQHSSAWGIARKIEVLTKERAVRTGLVASRDDQRDDARGDDEIERLAICSVWQLEAVLQGDSLYLSLIGTGLPTDRVLRSMEDIETHGEVDKRLQQLIFRGQSAADVSYPRRNEEEQAEIEQMLDAVRGAERMNASQREAVIETIGSFRSGGGVSLIMGPPGTGKSSTTVVLIGVLVHSGWLVNGEHLLQAATTNTAMIGVAKLVIQRLQELLLCPTDVLIVISDAKSEELLSDKKYLGFCLSARVNRTIRQVQSLRITACTLSSELSAWESEDIQPLSFVPLRFLYACTSGPCHFKEHFLTPMRAACQQYLNSGLIVQVFNEITNEVIAVLSLCLVEDNRQAYALRKQFALKLDQLVRVCDENCPVKPSPRRTPADGGRVEMSKATRLTLEQVSQEWVSRARIIFSTINGTMSKYLYDKRFAVVIVDEAAQAIEAETTLLLRGGLKSLVLIGDPKQLPGTVFSKACKEVRFERSLFQRLYELQYPVHMLKVQYRMHPDIARFSSSTFYSKEVVDGDCVKQYTQKWYQDELFPPVKFVKLTETASTTHVSGSRSNIREAKTMMVHLMTILNMYPSELRSGRLSIGIITPYLAQKQLFLNELLPKLIFAEESYQNVRIDVNTVDGFQGQERDIVFVSLTTTGWASKFVNDSQRMNVTISRAKYNLFVYGDSQAFHIKTGNLWSEFGAHHGTVFDTERLTKTKDGHEYCNKMAAIAPRGVFQQVEAASPMNNRSYVGWSSGTDKGMIDAGGFEWREYLADQTLAGIWTIIATDTVIKDMRTSNGLGDRYRTILAKLRMGKWNMNITRKPYQKTSEVAGQLLYVARISRSQLLCWTVDIMRKSQVIHLFQHSSPDALGQVWTNFQKALRAIPQDIIQARLNVLRVAGDGNDVTYIPRREFFVPDARPCGGSVVTAHLSDCRKLFDISERQVVDLIRNDADVADDRQLRFAIPYLLDDHQMAAASAQGNVVIIGRGGTGKTSVLATRIFEMYRMSARSDLPLPKQLFVSQSRGLVQQIKKEFQDLVQTFNAAALTSSLDSTSIDCDSISSATGVSPVAQTNQTSMSSSSSTNEVKFLSFFDLIIWIDTILATNSPNTRLLRDENSLNEDICAEELQHQLSIAVGNSAHGSLRKSASSAADRHYGESEVVNFDKFARLYYPAAPDHLRKSLSSALIFSEIMAIKSMNCITGHQLSREEYLTMDLGKHLQLVLSPESKLSIFTFLQKYDQMKSTVYHHVDIPDIMINLLKRLQHYSSKSGGLLEIAPLATIYVDEVQDLLPCQWSMFDLMRDKATTLVCCGDQAQAITPGNRFRFSELKSYMYTGGLADGSGNKHSSGYEEKYPTPLEIRLSINYRTKEPVLRLGNAIIQAIRHFFKDEVELFSEAVDASDGGKSDLLLLGPRIFREADALRYLFGGAKELSAEQVFLVRTSGDKSALLKWLEKQQLSAMVLTILEAKGLEFEDVILYNVLRSAFSPTMPSAGGSSGGMRLLYHFSAQEHHREMRLPEFDCRKYIDLCHWLKELYVAVTRAKSRLFFIDENIEDRKIFADVFHDHVQWTDVSDPIIVAGFECSTREDWFKKGSAYEASGLLFEAWKAYQYAGETLKASKMKAELLLRQHESDRGNDSLLVQAADIFLQIGKSRRAADLLQQARMYRRAAMIYIEIGLHMSCVSCLLEGKVFLPLHSIMKQHSLKFTANQRFEIWQLLAQKLYNSHHPRALDCLEQMLNDTDGNIDSGDKAQQHTIVEGRDEVVLLFLETKGGGQRQPLACMLQDSPPYALDLVKFYQRCAAIDRGVAFLTNAGFIGCLEELLAQTRIGYQNSSHFATMWRNRHEICKRWLTLQLISRKRQTTGTTSPSQRRASLLAALQNAIQSLSKVLPHCYAAISREYQLFELQWHARGKGALKQNKGRTYQRKSSTSRRGDGTPPSVDSELMGPFTLGLITVSAYQYFASDENNTKDKTLLHEFSQTILHIGNERGFLVVSPSLLPSMGTAELSNAGKARDQLSFVGDEALSRTLNWRGTRNIAIEDQSLFATFSAKADRVSQWYDVFARGLCKLECIELYNRFYDDVDFESALKQIDRLADGQSPDVVIGYLESRVTKRFGDAPVPTALSYDCSTLGNDVVHLLKFYCKAAPSRVPRGVEFLSSLGLLGCVESLLTDGGSSLAAAVQLSLSFNNEISPPLIVCLWKNRTKLAKKWLQYQLLDTNLLFKEYAMDCNPTTLQYSVVQCVEKVVDSYSECLPWIVPTMKQCVKLWHEALQRSWSESYTQPNPDPAMAIAFVVITVTVTKYLSRFSCPSAAIESSWIVLEDLLMAMGRIGVDAELFPVSHELRLRLKESSSLPTSADEAIAVLSLAVASPEPLISTFFNKDELTELEQLWDLIARGLCKNECLVVYDQLYSNEDFDGAWRVLEQLTIVHSPLIIQHLEARVKKMYSKATPAMWRWCLYIEGPACVEHLVAFYLLSNHLSSGVQFLVFLGLYSAVERLLTKSLQSKRRADPNLSKSQLISALWTNRANVACLRIPSIVDEYFESQRHAAQLKTPWSAERKIQYFLTGFRYVVIDSMKNVLPENLIRSMIKILTADDANRKERHNKLDAQFTWGVVVVTFAECFRKLDTSTYFEVFRGALGGALNRLKSTDKKTDSAVEGFSALLTYAVKEFQQPGSVTELQWAACMVSDHSCKAKSARAA